MVYRILRPDSISVWKNEEILKRFKNYKGIIDGTQIARYLIAKTLECKFNPNDSIENLEAFLLEKSVEFKELLKTTTEELKTREIKSKNYINLAETIANKYLESCMFCERECGANRVQNEKGYCLLTKDSYVSSAFLHMGEESVLIPSGTIFFQSCNFGCVFCQNYDISQAWKGKRDIEDIATKVNGKKLANLAENLADKGAININYVGGDPIPNLHTIVGNLNFQKTNICQLWNSNFYLTEKALSLIIDLMDFWLPDFKYGNNVCAKKYSGVENYFDVISRNHKKIHDEGSGEIIIRHLVMPNHIDCCSKPILDYVAKEIPKCVVNVMQQYRPQYKAYNYEEINRRPTSKEVQEVRDYASKLGILWAPVS
ncbi:MAG: 4Fe-4S cluster-binding domain-containing protein [Promethearchaeota archaeon]|nr:MAG: 4Fe-4S cluster-binding domain-containing protein [Candidatus Lokiarchaeota archaeon]